MIVNCFLVTDRLFKITIVLLNIGFNNFFLAFGIKLEILVIFVHPCFLLYKCPCVVQSHTLYTIHARKFIFFTFEHASATLEKRDVIMNFNLLLAEIIIADFVALRFQYASGIHFLKLECTFALRTSILTRVITCTIFFELGYRFDILCDELDSDDLLESADDAY